VTALFEAAGLVAGGLVVLAGLLVLRRRRRTGPGADIRLVASRYLGAKRFLTIVEVDGQRLLLGLAGDHVSLVARLGEGRHQEVA
jgi:flagellar biogenesis protein FliO